MTWPNHALQRTAASRWLSSLRDPDFAPALCDSVYVLNHYTFLFLTLSVRPRFVPIVKLVSLFSRFRVLSLFRGYDYPCGSVFIRG